MSKIAKDGYEYRKYIFISKENKQCKYLLLDKDCLNDGRAAFGKFVYYDVKFGSGYAGVIFEIETKLESNSISYSKKGTLPCEIWSNRADVNAWQAEQRALEDIEKLKKSASFDSIYFQLKNIRMSYNLLSNQQEKVLYLARVIAFVTKGDKL